MSNKNALDNKSIVQKIKSCVEVGNYKISINALDMPMLSLPAALYVLKNGKLEQTTDCNMYIIRGRTLDNLDLRVTVAFDAQGVLQVLQI